MKRWLYGLILGLMAVGLVTAQQTRISLAQLNSTGSSSGQVITSNGSGSAPTWQTNAALNASNISSGTLQAGRMPALTGDVTSSAGSVATTISNGAVVNAKIGVQAVTYDKISSGPVAATGQVLTVDTVGNPPLWDYPIITSNNGLTGNGQPVSPVGIASNGVTNARLAQMPANSLKCNNTGATANATDCTAAQATALLNTVTSSLKGLAPASGGGTTNFLRADGTWAAPGAAGYGDASTKSYFLYEFLNALNDSPFTATVSGTGAAFTTVGTATTNRPGLVTATTGTTATGRAAILTGATSVFFGGGRARFRADVQPVQPCDTGTEQCNTRIGFLDNAAGLATDGAFFEHIGTADATWFCKTRSNSTETSVNSNVVLSNNVWNKLEIDVNAAGTSVTYTIDGTSVCTITTNIPTGAGRQTGIGAGIFKSAGTTARTFNLDLIEVQFDFTTAR